VANGTSSRESREITARARGVASEALRKAGERLRGRTWSGLAEPHTVNTKGFNDFVTDLDRDVEEVIRGVIEPAFPDHGITGEELGTSRPDSEHTWYVDPVDGTRNLVAERPEVAVSLALYRGEAPLVAALSLPARGIEMLWDGDGVEIRPLAGRGEPSRSSWRLSESLVGLPGDFRPDVDPPRLARFIGALAGRVGGVRVTGSLAYDLGCIVLGELAARLSTSPKPVDVAAGAVLVERAGGVVTDLAGERWSPGCGSLLAAATPELHAELLEVISGTS